MCKLRAFDCYRTFANHSLLAKRKVSIKVLSLFCLELCGISGGCFLVTAPDPWNKGTLRIDMTSGQEFFASLLYLLPCGQTEPCYVSRQMRLSNFLGSVLDLYLCVT
ncbi:hypothetical protein T02_11278 [Trichinella nativa]|uniref:Uncharacterized protein n=1 Tax=Trichinella nativa TaxID=6335 RepID=A0A0V1KY78_9BILA|nr:hypothetical protein T02_11278 [Trichinella nativa]